LYVVAVIAQKEKESICEWQNLGTSGISKLSHKLQSLGVLKNYLSFIYEKLKIKNKLIIKNDEFDK
jgi:hypothetical protein